MLAAARYLQTIGDVFDPDDHRLFEYCCAYVLQKKISSVNQNTLLWDDINPDIKDSWNLPESDVGIDYAFVPTLSDVGTTIFGQAKCYSNTQYIPAKHMNRTAYCATHAGVKYIEFATKPHNRMGKPKIPIPFKTWNTFLEPHTRPIVATHTKISDQEFEQFHTLCVGMFDQLVRSDHVINDDRNDNSALDLRHCQKQALANMNKDYNRIVVF